MLALSSISHRDTNTERAPAVKEIVIVLREVDVCPLSETPSFTSVFSDAKNNNNKLVQMNSVILNNLNTIQYYSKRRHKVTECITNHHALQGKTGSKQIYYIGAQVDQI